MRSVFLTVVLSYLLLLGLSYPVAAVLVYVWIDLVKPQALAYSLITDMPVAMIAGIVVPPSNSRQSIIGSRQKGSR